MGESNADLFCNDSLMDDMNLDHLEANGTLRCRGRCRLLPHLGATNERVMPELAVWVLGSNFKPSLVALRSTPEGSECVCYRCMRPSARVVSFRRLGANSQVVRKGMCGMGR
jgi:hypothetical protein